MGVALAVFDGGVEVFEVGGVGGELLERFAGGGGGEAGVDELAEGALEIFGIFEVGGGVGDANLAFEVGEGEGGFVDFGVGFADGGFGEGFGDLTLGEFAADALGAEQAEVAAAVGVGFGEAFVVEEAGFGEAVEDGGDFGGVFGAGFEFAPELGGGGGAEAEGAEGEVHELFAGVPFGRIAARGHMKIVCNSFRGFLRLSSRDPAVHYKRGNQNGRR